MRKIGVTLLIAGFVWILLMQGVVLVRGGVRPIIGSAMGELESKPGKLYSADEVQSFVGKAANSASDAHPLFVLPGSLMLVGGLLAAVNRKRRFSNDV